MPPVEKCHQFTARSNNSPGIKFLLKDNKDISVIVEASSLSETTKKIAELRPDVILIDLSMTEGAEFGEFSSKNGPKVNAMSLQDGEAVTSQAKKIGAVKFIDKMHLAEELVPSLLKLMPTKPS